MFQVSVLVVSIFSLFKILPSFVNSFKRILFLGWAAILAAAQPLKIVFVVVLLLCCCCCVVAAKSTFTICLLTQRLEIQDLGSKLNFVGSSVTQKGLVHFKSAATAFFNNSGTISPRKLKLGIQVGNHICRVVMQIRRAWHTSKVLPHPFSITLEPLVLES